MLIRRTHPSLYPLPLRSAPKVGARADGVPDLRYTVSVGVFAASVVGIVDCIVVAFFGRFIPWQLPPLLLASYLLLGLACGGLLGFGLARLQRTGLANRLRGDRRVFIQSIYLSVYLGVVAMLFAVRFQYGENMGLGLPLGPQMIAIGVVATVLGGIVVRYALVRHAGPMVLAWPLVCAAFFCCLWSPFNAFYVAPKLAAESIAANGIYICVFIAVYLVGRSILGRASGREPSDTAGRYFRRAFAVSALGLGVSWSVLWLVQPVPLDRVHRLPSDVPLASQEKHANVLLIVADTVRADHLSLYGYERNTTPHLDSFAQEAIVFLQAIAPSSWTYPSHASLFTGLMPSEHGARYFMEPNSNGHLVYPLSEEHDTLAEKLELIGYDTGAVIANIGPLHRELRLNQGFRYYDDRPRAGLDVVRTGTIAPSRWLSQFYKRFAGDTHAGCKFRDAAEINAEALAWLDRTRSEPFFLFLNYADPHDPYRPHPELAEQLSLGKTTRYDDTKIPRKLWEDVDNYDAEIAYLDAKLGELFEALKTRGLYDSTMIIVTSDHGEAFGEHGFAGHRNTVYQEEVRVPLIVRYPGGGLSGVNPHPTSLTSIMPWVLAYLGGGENDRPFTTDVTTTKQVITELHRPEERIDGKGQWIMRGLFDEDGFKLVTTPNIVNGIELYDLVRDPMETQDLQATHRDAASALAGELLHWITEIESGAAGRNTEYVMSDELAAQLRSLGYLD